MVDQENPLAENIENTPVVEYIETNPEVEITEIESVVEPINFRTELLEKRKSPYRKPLVALLLVLAIVCTSVVLYKKKPTEKDFEFWVKKEAAEKRSKTDKTDKKGVSTATQIQILATYRYSDRKIIATVKASANGKKLSFLGIAGVWILLP